MKETIIDLNDFRLVEPAMLGTGALTFSVMTDGTLRINGKLQSKIKQNGLYIRTNSERNKILLEEAARGQQNVHLLAKNGHVKAQELMSGSSGATVKLPARYVVEWNDHIGMWVGKHDRHYSFPSYCKGAPHMQPRRRNNLKDMLPPEVQ